MGEQSTYVLATGYLMRDLEKGTPTKSAGSEMGDRRISCISGGCTAVSDWALGERAEDLMRRRLANVPRGVYWAFPIFAGHAHGSSLTDIDGREYLDFTGGIGALNVGHSNPVVIDAIKQQLERFTHTCFHVAMYESYIALAETLNRLLSGHGPRKTMFANSGAEGVENAVKIARHFTSRSAIICFEHAFHGRTLLTMSLTGRVSPFKKGFGPFAPEIYRVSFPYCYRCPNNLAYPECDTRCFDDLEKALGTRVPGDEVAAVILEPVLGEGGFVVVPAEYMAKLERLCRANDILLIFDEVQTGFGRTGRMFAFEHFGVEPDIVVAGKSLASGLPLSGISGRSEVMDSPQVGGLGGTYGGNPLACAAALAVIDVLEKERLVDRAEELGSRIKKRFLDLRERYPIVGDVRGLGAMMAIEFVTDRESKVPASEETQRVVAECFEKKLMILTCGTYGNVIRLLVPLVVSDSDLERGLDVLEQSIAQVSRSG